MIVKNFKKTKFFRNRRKFSSSLESTLQQLKEKYNIKDTSLTRYLEEKVILVDQNDNETGSLSLLESHLNTEIFSRDLTHRAFSLLLFDDDLNLLVQRRSNKKIAFPLTWGNSCCSHPLFNLDEERSNFENIGARKAAERRADEELNLEIKHEKIFSVGKIYYREKGEDFFGESEVDYILFSRVKGVKPEIEFNEREICEIDWVEKFKIFDFFEEKEKSGEEVAPWFKLMAELKLIEWWEELENVEGKVEALNGTNQNHEILS